MTQVNLATNRNRLTGIEKRLVVAQSKRDGFVCLFWQNHGKILK